MISREVWARLVKDFQEKPIPRLVKRNITIDTHTNLKRAITLIGPRRSGKSSLMFQLINDLMVKGIAKSRILYINFENDELIGCEVTDLREMLGVFYELTPLNKNEKVFLFLDEIQDIPNWERFIRTVIDTENVQVVLSGSSSKLLSKEVGTSLRGRSLVYHVFPFSFSEFLAAKDFKVEKHLSSSEKARMLNLLRLYLKGSYPEAVLAEDQRDKILKDVLDIVVYKDVIERFGVKNQRLLRLLLKAIINSKYFSIHKFFNFIKSLGMKASKNTLYNYLGYFLDSMVVFTLHKYSYSYKDIEQTTPKIYLSDSGLLYSNGIDDIGRAMENAIFLEFLRRGLVLDRDLFYFSDVSSEVDFYFKEGKKSSGLIQVCYDISNFETKTREVKALLSVSKKLSCSNLLVITWDYEAEEKIEGKKIKFIPLWKWILDLK